LLNPQTTYSDIVKKHDNNSTFSAWSKRLRLGNVNLGIDRNRLNTGVSIIGLVIVILALVNPGACLGVGLGVGIGIILGSIVLLSYLVLTKKLSIPQAIVYGLIITLMVSLALTPFAAKALLVFRVLYGVTVCVQGLVFGVVRGGVGIAADECKNLRIAREFNDSSQRKTAILGIASNSFSIMKGLGYFGLGALKIASASVGIAIPGWDKLDDAIAWTARVVYYVLNNSGLIVKIWANYSDMCRLEKFHNELTSRYKAGTIDQCKDTIIWFQNYLNITRNQAISESDFDTKHFEKLLSSIHSVRRNTDGLVSKEITDYENYEKILNDLKNGESAHAQAFIQVIIDSNQRQYHSAKTQFQINIVYLIGSPLLVLLYDSGIVTDSLLEKFSIAASNSEAVREAWVFLISALKGVFAAQINVKTRDFVETKPPISEEEQIRLNNFMQPDSDAKAQEQQGFNDYWYTLSAYIAEKIRELWAKRKRSKNIKEF